MARPSSLDSRKRMTTFRQERRFSLLRVSAAVVAVAAIALWLWLEIDAPFSGQMAAAAADPGPSATLDASRAASALAVVSPPSTEGARHQALVVNAELRYWLESILSAAGDRSNDELRADAEREIDLRYAASGAAEAKRLLGRYMEFRQAKVMLQANPPAPGRRSPVDALRARQTEAQQLRGRYFSQDEAKRLFGVDDAVEAAELARLQINLDSALDSEQKQARILALNESLERTVREMTEQQP